MLLVWNYPPTTGIAVFCINPMQSELNQTNLNPLTAGAAYIRVLIFY